MRADQKVHTVYYTSLYSWSCGETIAVRKALLVLMQNSSVFTKRAPDAPYAFARNVEIFQIAAAYCSFPLAPAHLAAVDSATPSVLELHFSNFRK